MKKHFLLGLTAVAAMCLFSCNKENVRPSESTQTINFTALTPDTKTYFGEKAGNAYPTLWTGNEQVAVSYNGGAKTTASVSGNGKSASISAETVVDGNATEHKFMLASPAAAITSFDKSGDFYFTIPSVQTPGEGTCDEAAQIIYATASCTAEALNSNISLTFKHLTAYGNMSVVLPEGAGKVKQIELMTAATGLTGSYRSIYSEIPPEAEESKLTLWTDKTTGIFFACAPADLNGENLVVTVTTDKGVYEKDIDLTDKTLSFKAGKVSKFTVKDFKEIKTYRHIFNAKPTIGSNIKLSNMSWSISATNLNGYNSQNYAGVQFGTSKKNGKITLTSSNAWSYQNATTIKEVRLWLNTGGSTVTPKVTINNKAATSDGTK
ncbi:MAG: fimbrillin family protein, partial [Bacteroidales bacterium]|nr:fimbrillin family protein [Bacteroidales bacterium]